MRKIDETRTCDACGEVMQKDGPIWYGGELTVHENYAAMDHYPHEEFTVDMCRECLKKVRAMVKREGFGEPLPPELREQVDRAVSSMAREAGRR